MKSNYEKTKENLEVLVDSLSLTVIVEILAEICHEKASHIEENWQDAKLAKVWTKDAERLETISAKLNCA